MSYEMCLEKAGATVVAFQEFGSYQGEWFALVEYNGERGWVEGSCETEEEAWEFCRGYNEANLWEALDL